MIHTERRAKGELRKYAITRLMEPLAQQRNLVGGDFGDNRASSWRKLLAKVALYINRDLELELNCMETMPSSVCYDAKKKMMERSKGWWSETVERLIDARRWPVGSYEEQRRGRVY